MDKTQIERKRKKEKKAGMVVIVTVKMVVVVVMVEINKNQGGIKKGGKTRGRGGEKMSFLLLFINFIFLS